MCFLGQVCLSLVLCSALLGQEKKRAFAFESPVVKESVFKDEIGMTDRERDDYATQLSIFAGNEVVRQKGHADSLSFARRAIALAFHLSARNKRAVVLNHQLSKGVIPNLMETKYNPQTLAALFVSRAEILYQQKGKRNQLLARCFIDLAVTMDSKNEDAIYAYEMQKIDLGAVPWSRFTDAEAVSP